MNHKLHLPVKVTSYIQKSKKPIVGRDRKSNCLVIRVFYQVVLVLWFQPPCWPWSPPPSSRRKLCGPERTAGSPEEPQYPTGALTPRLHLSSLSLLDMDTVTAVKVLRLSAAPHFELRQKLCCHWSSASASRENNVERNGLCHTTFLLKA